MSRFGAAVSGYKSVDEKSGLKVSYIPRLRRTLKTIPIYSNARKEYTGNCPCNICGVKYKAITETHLRYVHNVSMKEYRGLYPSAVLFDEETLDIIRSNAKEIGLSRIEYKVGICVECGREYPIRKERQSSSGRVMNNRARTCSPKCLLDSKIRHGQERKKSFCLKGHKMDESNAVLSLLPKTGRIQRHCRKCFNEYKKIWRKTRKKNIREYLA
jgi:hypothetical protein